VDELSFGLRYRLQTHAEAASLARSVVAKGPAAPPRDDWPELKSLSPALLARWPALAPVGPSPDPANRIRGAIEFRLRGWHRQAVSVALIGPDGAGKTTLAGEAENRFVFPRAPGLHAFDRRAAAPRKPPRAFPVSCCSGNWWCSRDDICMLGRYARSLQARGALVLFDRYVYDAVAPTPYPPSRAGPPAPRPRVVVRCGSRTSFTPPAF
jgi:hypothetical protein